MKNYFKYFLWSILLCFPYFVLGKVTCNSGDYSATLDLLKESISTNESTNINITSNNDYKITYSVHDKSIINISDNGLITPIKPGSTKISAYIEFLEDGVKVQECTSNLNINVLSNDSSLKLLNLEELDISSVFNTNTYIYEVRLPYNYEKINIIAEANDANAIITGDGRRYLNEGTNEYEIIVKATDGTTSTYKIVVLREEANDDNTLKSLIVEGYEISPKFNKDTYEYTLNVDKMVDSINISATATYNLAKILGTGKYNLATGENTFYITVIAENNTEQKYTLIVNKNKGDARLNSLEIDGYKLDKDFDSETFTYNLTINSDVDKLNILAKTDEGQVEIIGNEELKHGENNIIIRVSGEDIGSTTYKLIVNKLSIEEQKEQEKNDMLLKILFVMFIISIIIMATLIGIFLKRNYINKNKKKIKKINIKKENKR